MFSPVQLSLEELPNSEALDKARSEIQGRLAEGGSRLAQLNWQLFRNAAGRALQKEFRKLDVLDEIAGAWCTFAQLQELAQQTLNAPGKEEPLPLLEHDPSVDLHPVIKIKCGPVEFPALTFGLRLGVSVECVVLIVAGGKLAAIEAGSFTPFAQLSYGDHMLKRLDGNEQPITKRYNLPNGGIIIPCSVASEGDRSAA